MSEVPLHRRFAGQARLIRLLLWRVGDTTDINTCLATAQDMEMISADDAAFLVECLNAEERQRAGDDLGMELDQHTVDRLQRCADKLNRADAA